MDRRSQATFFPWWMGDSLDCVLLTRYPISIPPLFSQHWHRLQRDDFHMIPPQPISSNGAARQKHVTRRGDTLHTVARKYGITPTELQQWNALQPGTLRPGLSLHVSPPPRQDANPAPQQVHARQPAVASSVNVRIHVVKSGETVYAISRQYPGTTPEAILRINSIQGPILPGQKLKIPSTPN
jgi:LysM repeat protein